ncbi:metallophosphoesterase [Crocinitomicaceae bacterium]|nr:metallophosphoesterase [Crocinitomicaceae bacterium]MDC3308861.1 metallophosphoesterase [Crocinitomicaceae bacterium]
MKLISFLFISFLFASSSLIGQNINVGPYLQNAEPSSITIMWETSSGNESTVEWGTSNILGNSSSGVFISGNGLSRIHTTMLSGLESNTKYYYKVITNNAQSDIFDFVTPPLPNSEAPVNLVSMSDMQQDWQHTNVFEDIINDELIPFVNNRFGNDLATDISYVFIPGDLVVTGSNYSSWESTFFDPAQALFRHVPVYPVAGNHEQNSENYFKYFTLPTNGTNQNDYLEHWYYKDYSNVRLIGLETNSGYRIQEQLDWLQGVLDDASNNEHIDFVFAQLHHPHHSELWIAGNTDYTGDIISLLEGFSSNCGKPSIHFFGHTHGYSRGQSRDHEHLMVNVATAGGAIDNWGEYAQQDYKEFSRSDDDYGFVLLEVEAGNDPQFLLTRVSHGSYEDGLVNNEIKDTIRVRANNINPDKPSGLFPYEGAELSPDCIVFLGSNFSDDDNPYQGAVHWQVSTDLGFSSLIYDDWFQHENWYYDEDLEAGNSMTEREINSLQESTNYFWRVRYRDRSLGWSDWSDPIEFSTLLSVYSANLLQNPGAEDGTSSWTAVSGSFESILSGECAGNNSYSGARLFAVGGVCDPNAYGEGYQDIDLLSYSSMIDNDSAIVFFGGYLSDYSGDDIPAFYLEFYNAGNSLLGSTMSYESSSSEWEYLFDNIAIPATTRKIRMVLTGTRNVGTDNDSYFDDLFLRIKPIGDDCEQLTLELKEEVQPIKIYPNPTGNVFFIESNSSILNTSFYLYDQEGRILIEGILDSTKKEINLSKYAKGVYYIKVGDLKDYKVIKSF